MDSNATAMLVMFQNHSVFHLQQRINTQALDCIPTATHLHAVKTIKLVTVHFISMTSLHLAQLVFPHTFKPSLTVTTCSLTLSDNSALPTDLCHPFFFISNCVAFLFYWIFVTVRSGDIVGECLQCMHTLCCQLCNRSNRTLMCYILMHFVLLLPTLCVLPPCFGNTNELLLTPFFITSWITECQEIILCLFHS